MKDFDKKIAALGSASDGASFCNKLTAISRKSAELTQEELKQFVDFLLDYSFNGIITFHRPYALSWFVKLIGEGEKEYGDLLLNLMNCGESDLEYWAVSGYAKAMGKDGYREIVDFIQSPTHSVESRGNAVKSLAMLSKQRFDEGRSPDPGYWKDADIDIEQILDWQKNGYKDGAGYSVPERHDTLDNPGTALEKCAARLEGKLRLKRQKQQDMANPSNWLAVANVESMSKLEQFIHPRKLEENYRLFLERYSPVRCSFRLKGVGTLDIYSAENLIRKQQGYSLNGQERLPGWPESYLVIADSNADPFCIDLAQQNSPIYFAYHGTGSWDFEENYPDFLSFIKSVSV